MRCCLVFALVIFASLVACEIVPTLPVEVLSELTRWAEIKGNCSRYSRQCGRYGTMPTPAAIRALYDKPPPAQNIVLPKHFDLRQKYPHCVSLTTPVDQGQCGSCWAQSTSGAAADRLCMGGGPNVLPAVQHLLACDKSCYDWRQPMSCQGGCQGGFPDLALAFMKDNYFTLSGCVRYTGKDVRCPERCDDQSPISAKYRVKSFAHLTNNEAIKEAIFTGGSVVATFLVYQDYESYRGGIYQHRYGMQLGGHAVKLIGWGEDARGTPYWLVQNSYGTRWGEGGYFKFIRGTNDCGIEENVWEVIADFPQEHPLPVPVPVPPGPVPPGPVPPGPVPPEPVTPITPPSRDEVVCEFKGQPGVVADCPDTQGICAHANQHQVCLVAPVDALKDRIVNSLARLDSATAFERCYSNAQQFFCGEAFPKYDPATRKALPLCRSACVWFGVRCGKYYPVPDCTKYPQESSGWEPPNCFVPPLE